MISAIIPSYNAAPVICRAIDSVFAQTYSDYEIIVVDDGSTDNTAEVIKKYGGKVRYIYQNNAGASVARNTGIEAATGDWIAFLDADDEWLPDKLKLQTELLARNPELRWCASNRYQSDRKRRAVVCNVEVIEKALARTDYFENFFVAAARGILPIIPSVMMVRKSVFYEVGMFEPGRASGEDLDMWWRIAYLYPKIGYLATPMATIYLDVDNVVFTERRLSTKRGANARELITRHLQLAQEHSQLDSFRPYAKKLLCKSLITAIYYGYKTDSRITVKQFSDFFPWYWRFGTYLLTLTPNFTSFALRNLLYLRYLVGLEKQVSRRWLYTKNTYKKT